MTADKSRLTFYPFAYALNNDELCSFCWYCLGSNTEMKRCLGCGMALFCNKDCQTLGWKDHKGECAGIRNCSSLPDIETRLLGRIVVRQRDIVNGKDKKDCNFYKDRYSQRSILEIWAHTDDIRKDTYAMGKFESIYQKLVGFYESKYLLPKDDVFELHCRDYINRHAISDRSYIREIGKGLYLDLCAYDHSCRPNTIYSCVGFVATLRSLNGSVDLSNKKTTFYSYIDLLCSQQERQKLLLDTWYFKCRCERCIDEKDQLLTSVLCPKCPGGRNSCVPIFCLASGETSMKKTISCPSCSTTLSEEYVNEAKKTMRFIDRVISDKELEQMPPTSRQEFLFDLLERFLKILPSINVYVCRIVQHLIPLLAPSNHSELLRLHLLSEDCVRHCFPHNHPAVAFHLRNIGIFYMGLNNQGNAVKYLKEAQEILTYTLDSDHPMTTENKALLDEALAMVSKDNKKKSGVVDNSINVAKVTNSQTEKAGTGTTETSKRADVDDDFEDMPELIT